MKPFPPVGNWLDYLPHGTGRVADVIASLVLLLLPLIYLGGEPWWLPAAFSFLCLACSMRCLHCWRSGEPVFHYHCGRWLLLFGLPLLWGALQLIPLHGLLSYVAPQTAAFRREFDALGIGVSPSCLSLTPHATVCRMFLWLACGLVFLYVIMRMHHSRPMKVLLLLLGLAAFGNAAYAFCNFAMKGIGADVVRDFSGMFQNRNHFAFFQMLGIFSLLPLCFLSGQKEHHGLVLSRRSAGRLPESRGLFARKTFFFLLILLECAALLMSGSRGGFFALLTGGCCFGCGVLWRYWGRLRHRRLPAAWLALAVMLLVALGTTSYGASQRVLRRMKTTHWEQDEAMRESIWRDTLRMVRDYWQTGVGMGGYGSMAQPYSGGHAKPLVVNAHNDYLEFLAECGLPFGIFWILFAAFAWWSMTRRVLGRRNSVSFWCGLGAFSALLGGGMHELCDYSLQAWPNSLAFAALVGVLAVCSSHRTASILRWRMAERGIRRSNPAKENAGEGSGERRGRLHGNWRCVRFIAAGGLLLGSLWSARGCVGECYVASLRKEFASGIPASFLGRKDDFRRLDKANAALTHSWWSIPRVCGWRARVLWEASRRSPEKAAEYLAQACGNLSRCLRMVPGDPVQAIACASLWEEAALAGVHSVDAWQLLSLYTWAVKCRPNSQEVTRRAALSGYRWYLAMLLERHPRIEEGRERLLWLFRMGLEENPQNGELSQLLLQLKCSEEEMAEAMPQKGPGFLKFTRGLLEKGQPEAALAFCRKVDALDGPADGQSSEELSWVAQVLGLEMELLERLGRREERNECWKKLTAARLAYEEAELAAAKRLISKGREEVALQRMRQGLRLSPVLPEMALEAAKLARGMGEAEQIPYLLTSLLCYSGEMPPPALLREAKALLPQGMELAEATVFRVNFLQGALEVMAQEQTPQEPAAQALRRRALQEAAERLEALAECVRGQNGDTLWVQDHLVALFAGRARALLGDNAAAVRNYRRVLKESPRNWYAIRALRLLDASALSGEESELYRKLSSRQEHPVCRYPNGLVWLGLSSEPDEITKENPVQRLECYLMLEQPAACELQGTYVFSRRDGRKIMPGLYRFPQTVHSMFSWRVGEVAVWRMEEEFPVHVNPQFRNGDVFLELEMRGRYSQAYPPAVAYAGTIGDVKKKEGNGGRKEAHD